MLYSPVSKQTDYNVEEILEDIAQGGDRFPGVQRITWMSKPVLQCQMVSEE